MTTANITAETLRQLLEYCPETGHFFRRIRAGRSGVGVIAGTIESNGYVRIEISGRPYRAHRLAFLYMTDAWPLNEVDHIDGNKTNNRWSNLRDVTDSVNLQNRKRATRRNKLGVLGVYFCKGKYLAGININGKRKHLGTFPTAEEAHLAYLDAKRMHHEGNTL